MEINFDGKKILVTGSAGGIGAEIVRQLSAAGATVIAAARREDQLADLQAETGCEIIAFDVTDEDSIKAALENLPLWGVVNCAGVGGEIAKPWETDTDVFDKTWAVNTRGTMLVIKYTSKTLIDQGQGGAYVNVSSQASLIGLPNHFSYGASKGGVDVLTKVAAMELGPYGIRVNSVHPCAIMTEMSAFYWGRPDIAEPTMKRMPLGRWATEADVASPVVFLLSDMASMITGAHLPIDGGYTAV